MKPLAALLLATSLFATPGAAEESIRIKGSDTIGGRAMPEIAEAWGKKSPGVRMTVEALGSSTAFVGLFDGSADIGASSRPINEKELATARDLGLKLQEIVIGFDGVAVIVHPKNPLRELSIAQISALFTGKTKRWKEVGGEDVPVRLISRPSYSGTHAFFKEKVLRRGNAKGPEEFAASAELMEENGEILRAVASDPRAISYVGLGWVDPTVRALLVAPRGGDPGVAPSGETVRTGRYPLYRPLLMYVPPTPRPAVADFLRFVLSKDGSGVMARNGFIPADPSAPLPAFLASSSPRPPADAPTSLQPSVSQASSPLSGQASGAPTSGGAAASSTAAPAPPARRREVVRITFAFGATALPADSAQPLDEVAKRLQQGGTVALITGHADANGKPEVNQKVALARAHAVANGLLRKGAPPASLRAEASGSDAPLASNQSTEGRSRNRRVDIELVTK